ncbi:glycoside hydrolase domain-containing protein [Streptomyces sp. NPDC057582]|uniref:glycoside hydrolase domain-containing protein n=1 Tax=unclassified Streptomyces TaxID=2593676 RepID=UPI0036A58DE8
MPLTPTLRDEHYERPLNTNYHRHKPLVTPRSWVGDDRCGGMRPHTADGVRTLTAFSGPLRLQAGESRCFELRLLLTPFKPLEPGRHLAERYFHAYATPHEVAEYGATVGTPTDHPPLPRQLRRLPLDSRTATIGAMRRQNRHDDHRTGPSGVAGQCAACRPIRSGCRA